MIFTQERMSARHNIYIIIYARVYIMEVYTVH